MVYDDDFPTADRVARWRQHTSKEKCICGLNKCYLIIEAAAAYSGYVTVKVCVHCDTMEELYLGDVK